MVKVNEPDMLTRKVNKQVTLMISYLKEEENIFMDQGQYLIKTRYLCKN